MTANVAPDWRYALSSDLGFICAALFAYAAVELLSVMEKRYGLNSGFESFGWLLMYLVCAIKLVGKEGEEESLA